MNEISLTAEERHQLLTVLREMDRHAPAEKRNGSRRKVFVRMWIRTISNGRCTRQRATLINVSKRGIGLQTAQGMTKSERFILPMRFQDDSGWLVLGEVRSCHALEGGFKVGAVFIDRIEDPKGNASPPLDWIL